METLRRRAASGLIGVATAMAMLALVIPLFLNPVWVAFEQAHMRDVRGVFIGFFVVAIGLAVVAGVVALVRRRSRLEGSAGSWRAVRNGAVGPIAGLALVGAFAFVAFDVLFEVFHRLFFAGGSYTFDPGTERLVQLFPFQFWQETSVAVGVVAAGVAAIVAAIAQRRSGGARAGAVTSARATA